MSEQRPLLGQNNILIQCRAPKRDDLDQSNALNLASAGGCNLDACVCLLGRPTWRRDHVPLYELLWAFLRQFEHILFIKTNCTNTPKPADGKSYRFCDS